MNREIWRLYHIIQYTILLIVAVANISVAEDNSLPQDNSSDWLGVIIGVVLPSLILIVLAAVVYIKLKKKREQDGKQTRKNGLRVTSSSRRNERDLSMSVEKLWEIDESATSLEKVALSVLQNATRLCEADKMQEYYAAISSIIKRYVAAKFGVKVVGATTGEILENLPQNLADHAGEILRICDLVEFSHYKPSQKDVEDIYQLTAEFIENQLEDSGSGDDEPENSDTNELDGVYKQFQKLQRQRWK